MPGPSPVRIHHGLRPPLGLPGAVGLEPSPRGEVADQERDHEHDREGDEVLRVADCESQVRRDEKKVEKGPRFATEANTDGPTPKRVATNTTPSR